MRFAVRDGLVFCSQLAIVSISLLRKASANAIEPISVTFGQNFLGYDGQWSAAQIRVGSPEQWLSVLPSTTESEAWVVGPAGCDGTSTCSSLRGGLFSSDQSKTWQELGLYELGFSALSQNTDNGDYGLDTLSLSDTVSAPNQIIALVNDTDHWLGQLGLVVQETRFQNATNHLPFISTLVQTESIIPSHSYGYTAGAFYKGKGSLGSLTLGGVDTTRFMANDFWFSLAPGYIPSVAVNSITVSATNSPQNWSANPLTLLPSDQAGMFTVDSNTPFLWVPESVCETIAQALNLTWNESVQLYTFANSSSPQNLLPYNLQFTFNLANSIGSSQTLALNVSYSAFNLQLSYPFPGLFESYSDTKVNYFPLRRANSSNQYTIGRSFLQEVYLTVDYERNVFALSQALFPESSQQVVLNAISRPDNSTWPGPQTPAGMPTLSAGAMAGIVVGIVVAAVAAGVLLWRMCTRKRKYSERLEDGEAGSRSTLFSIFSKQSKRSSGNQLATTELHADKWHPTEMVSDSSNSRYELSAIAPVEMAAADVSHTFFQPRENTRIAQRNDPRSPVELPYPRPRMSNEKGGVERVVDQQHSPTPAYTPNDVEERSNSNSNSISPFTSISPNTFRDGSHQAVSPVKSTSNGHSDTSSRLYP